MPSDDLKNRIEGLNRKPLRNVPDAPEIKALRRKLEKTSSQPKAAVSASLNVPEKIVYSRHIPATATPARYAEPRDFGPPIALDDAIEGVVAEAPAGPGYFLIEMPARHLEAEAALLHRRFVSLTGHPDGNAVEGFVRHCESERIAPDDVLFLDLETTGLSMTPVFLVGTMECGGDGFLFRQYFARDYSEEISILAAASERMKNAGVLVTFNGKSFDEPYLRSRAAATGVKMSSPRAHIDLLHEARRKYKPDLPNCRLQTLEQMVCGRCREEDIPSSEIPAAYHDFVRTGNANQIKLILQHNLYDLLTMADLMARMWGRD